MDKIFEKFQAEIKKEYVKNQDMLEQVIYSKQEEINKKEQLLNTTNETLNEKENIITSLNRTIEELKNECNNYENVSIHKNLDKQLSERDNEIRILNNKLRTLEKNYEKLNSKYESVILQNSEVEMEIVQPHLNEEVTEALTKEPVVAEAKLLVVHSVLVIELSLYFQVTPLELVGKFKYLPVPSFHD